MKPLESRKHFHESRPKLVARSMYLGRINDGFCTTRHLKLSHPHAGSVVLAPGCFSVEVWSGLWWVVAGGKAGQQHCCRK